MNRATSEILRWTGHAFTLVAAILFYNHLVTAVLYGDFVVHVYFNHFGEGTVELIAFMVMAPFIVFSAYMQFKETFEAIKVRKNEIHRKTKNT